MKPRLGTKELLLICRAGAVLRDLGLDDLPVLDAVATVRRQRCEERGIRGYLFEALGGFAKAMVKDVVLFRDGTQLPVPQQWAECSVVEYLSMCFDESTLPNRIEIGEGRSTSRILHM
jgi:hypothetical protein